MTQTAEVFDWREERDALRERERKAQLRAMGAGTREAALLKIEAMVCGLDHWHRKCMTARYLNGRLLAILAEANRRHAQTQALLAESLRETERLRELVK